MAKETMAREIEEKLAHSLTAETTELLPFLPYLLQDLWELGSKPNDIVELIRTHVPLSEKTKILDLACGKGAVAITLAQCLHVKSLPIKIDGFDLLPEFIEYARDKAKELNVSPLCNFKTGEINNIVKSAKNYDCVILGAAGDILGSPRETLEKLSQTIKPKGFVVIADGYLSENSATEDLKYIGDCLTQKQWIDLFDELELILMEEMPSRDYDYDHDMKMITARAAELMVQYPDRASMFEGYVKSQQQEVDDLHHHFVGATWILQSKK